MKRGRTAQVMIDVVVMMGAVAILMSSGAILLGTLHHRTQSENTLREKMMKQKRKGSHQSYRRYRQNERRPAVRNRYEPQQPRREIQHEIHFGDS